MIKNTLSDKPGDPGSLKKIIAKFECFSTNAPIVGKDFLSRSTGCFIHSFVIQVISETTLRSKGFTRSLRDIFT